MRVQPPLPTLSGDIDLDALACSARAIADALSTAAGSRAAVLRIVQPPRPRQSVSDGGLAEAARSYLRARRQRDTLFPPQLFGDPAWDILLDLFAAKAEGKEVAVSAACIAANVPVTTALRWLALLEKQGLVTRRPDPKDARRAYVDLTESANQRIALWLEWVVPQPAAE